MFPRLHCKLLWINASVKWINTCSVSVFVKSCMCTHTFSALNFFSPLVINKSITCSVLHMFSVTLQGEVESLGKKTGYSERQIHRWFRRRRNQERPNQMKKFKEARYRAILTGWSHTFINGHKLHHAAYFISFTKSNWPFNVNKMNGEHDWATNGTMCSYSKEYTIFTVQQRTKTYIFH